MTACTHIHTHTHSLSLSLSLTHTHTLSLFLSGCLELGLAPDLGWPCDMNPADYIAQVIVELALRPLDNIVPGHSFHMCHPQAMPMPQLWQWLQNFGYKLEVCDYSPINNLFNTHEQPMNSP